MKKCCCFFSVAVLLHLVNKKAVLDAGMVNYLKLMECCSAIENIEYWTVSLKATLC